MNVKLRKFLTSKTKLFLEARERYGFSDIGFGSLPRTHHDYDTIPLLAIPFKIDDGDGKVYASIQLFPEWYSLKGFLGKGSESCVIIEPAPANGNSHLISCYVPNYLFLQEDETERLHDQVVELSHINPRDLSSYEKKELTQELNSTKDSLAGPHQLLFGMSDVVFQGALGMMLAHLLVRVKNDERSIPEILYVNGYLEPAIQFVNYMKRFLWQYIKKIGPPAITDDDLEDKAIEDSLRNELSKYNFKVKGLGEERSKAILRFVGQMHEWEEALKRHLYS